ncbi:hypothetical protein F2Q69_00017436 [Brassica cretica]|uniref:Uncharacterized protein n=1 Tax=Brassica cretica TaxID=69181 RepID=A0A8S9QPJ3_BRACR|nr:hypothetical protein F2Q69_00017436 [Brassica cretica]
MTELVYETADQNNNLVQSRFVAVPVEAGGRGVNVDPTLVSAGFYCSRQQTFSTSCRV